MAAPLFAIQMRRYITLPTLLILAATVTEAQYVDITNSLYPERYPQEQQDALNRRPGEPEDTTHNYGDDIEIKSPLVLKYMHQRDSIEAVENNPYVQMATNTVAPVASVAPKMGAASPGATAVVNKGATAPRTKLMDDPERARIVEGAVAGDMQSQYELGRIYDEGKGIPRNSTEAAYWYRRAARNGHPDALLALGKAFRAGDGVLQDSRIAAENFWRAAERGNAEGAYLYASMLTSGEGVAKDLPRALRYFMLAAENNYADADAQVSKLRSQGVRMHAGNGHKGSMARTTSHKSRTAASHRKTSNKRRR